MAITEGSIDVVGTSDKLDTVVVTTGEGSVHREVVVIGDPENPDARQKVDESGAAHITLGDTMLLDAFGRVRTSLPVTVFESVQRYGDDLLKWETSVSGTGAAAASLADCANQLSTGGTANGATCIRQSRRNFRYQAAKSLLVECTFVAGTAYTNCVREVGLFNSNNGIFFRLSGSDLYFVRRSDTSGSVVNDSIARASWNGDPLDGTGESGITLDLTKAQILFIDMQYLGVGRVRVGFVIDGVPRICHEFRSANSVTTVYMRTATLPVRYAVYNAGIATGTGTLLHICSAVMVEGGTSTGPTYPFTHNNGVTSIAVTTRRPVLSIRAKTTGPNSVANTGTLIPRELDVSPSTNGCLYELVLNGSLTGASWSAINASYSLAEGDVSATAISGGIVIGSGYAASGSGSVRGILTKEINKDLELVYSSLGSVQDILSVVCTSMTGTSNVLSALSWDEAGV